MDREFSLIPKMPAEWTQVAMDEHEDRFAQANRWRTLLHRYGSALRRRWWIPLLSLLIIGGAAGTFAWLKAPTYRARASMWMAGKLSQVSLPDISPHSEELSRFLGTQADLLKSDAIQRRAYQNVRRQYPELEPYDPENPPMKLPFEVKIQSIPSRSAVLDLSAVGEHRAATRAFLNALMDEYLAFKQESRKETSGNALVSITDQIEDVEEHLREQQRKIDAFQRSNNVAYLSEQRADAGKQMAELETEMSELRTEYRVLELLTPQEITDLRKGQNLGISGMMLPGQKTAQELTPQFNAAAQAYYQGMQQLELLKSRRDQFARYLRPNHSKMIQFNQEIEGYDKLLRTLEQDDQKQAAQQLAILKKRLLLQVRNLETRHREWKAAGVTASATLAEFEPLKQELLRSQGLYDRLLNLVQTVDLNKNLEQDSLSIMERATRARPTYMGLKITIVAVVFSLLAGVGLVFVVESLNDRFISAQELSLQLPQEIVGQIPEIASVRRGEPRLLDRNGATHRGDERIVFDEAFRSLRSSVLFMYEPAHRPKVILLTSALPEEGKTTIAAHLASTLAAAGARVLLIDADLRRSALHKVFQVNRGPGLCEVLSGQAACSDAIVPVGRREEPAPGSDGQDNKLYLLPAGKAAASSSSELFLGGSMDRLLEEVSPRYDYVLMDTAPVLATDEASTLAPKADGVFVVVRAFYTPARTAREALERLTRRRAKVLGLIYNRAEPRSDYFYQYHYNYSAMEGGNGLPAVR